MNDKKITESESLLIITEMIKNARTNLRAQINCNILLLWGYTSVLISLGVWLLKINNTSVWSSLFWMLIPLVCIPATVYLNLKDKTKITSYIDRSIFYIVILFAFVCTFFAFSTLITDSPILFIEQVLINMMMMILGILIKYKTIILGGILGIILAPILLFIPDIVNQIPLFAISMFFSIIIPGQIFKKSITAHV